MMNGENKESGRNIKTGKAMTLVLLMLTSTLISLVPTVYASHTTQYAVQRDPSAIAEGSL